MQQSRFSKSLAKSRMVNRAKKKKGKEVRTKKIARDENRAGFLLQSCDHDHRMVVLLKEPSGGGAVNKSNGNPPGIL